MYRDPRGFVDAMCVSPLRFSASLYYILTICNIPLKQRLTQTLRKAPHLRMGAVLVSPMPVPSPTSPRKPIHTYPVSPSTASQKTKKTKKKGDEELGPTGGDLEVEKKIMRRSARVKT